MEAEVVCFRVPKSHEIRASWPNHPYSVQDLWTAFVSARDSLPSQSALRSVVSLSFSDTDRSVVILHSPNGLMYRRISRQPLADQAREMVLYPEHSMCVVYGPFSLSLSEMVTRNILDVMRAGGSTVVTAEKSKVKSGCTLI